MLTVNVHNPSKGPQTGVESGRRRGGGGGDRGDRRENFGKFGFFIVFCKNFGPEPLPERPDNPSGHFEPVSASPDHSHPILQHFYITKSKGIQTN